MVDDKEVLLTEAALRLGISWERAWRLVLTGQLKGQKKGKRWLVDSQSLKALESKEDNPPRDIT
jgi:hypothetical protein